MTTKAVQTSLFDLKVPKKTSASKPLPPSARGSATSEAAAESMRDSASTLRDKVFDLISASDPPVFGVVPTSHGLTCDEIEERTGLRHQTASARVYELAKAGRIVPSGTRRTRSGRQANVWVVAR